MCPHPILTLYRNGSRALFFLAATLVLGGAGFTRADEFDVSATTLARIKKFIPRAAAKLRSREPVHIAVYGDSVTNGYVYSDNRGSLIHAYPGEFASRFAKEFFYTGSVREVNPAIGHPEKLDPSLGPEITIEGFAQNGADVFGAFRGLTTVGFDNQPDIVTVKYGINDSRRGLPLGDYVEALELIATTITAKGADGIFIAPSLTMDGGLRFNFGISRPYVSAMREVAQRHGFFFSDSQQLVLAELYRGGGDDPQAVLADIEDACRPMFEHGTQEDYVHPNARAQKMLGKRIAIDLLEGSPAIPFQIKGTLDETASGTYRFNGQIQSLSGEAVEAVVCPLSLGMSADPVSGEDGLNQVLTLQPGKPELLSITYQVPEAGVGKPARPVVGLPSFEPSVWVSFVVVSGKKAYFVDARAPRTPFAVTWDTGASYNLADKFSVRGSVTNTGAAPISGGYTASWAGQKAGGKIRVGPGESQPVELTFKFPVTGPAGRAIHKLQFAVETGGLKFASTREIEVSKNIALGQRVPLLSRDVYVPGSDPDKLAASGAVSATFRADVDSKALYIIVDLKGYELFELPGFTAANLDLMIDGRYFEQRGMFGTAGRIQALFNATDGPAAKIKGSKFGTFGSGYDRPVKPNTIGAILSTRPSGERRITVTIPRSYFYLHEWAIGNGNSAIGIKPNLGLFALDKDSPAGGAYPGEFDFHLVTPVMAPRDARSLPLLEFTNKASGRWTMRFY